MPTVEELTPGMLWTAMYVIIAFCILFMVVYKVYDAIRTVAERRRQRIEAQRPDFAEAVSQKVIDKLEPRFKEIEKNLAKDKERLDRQESAISGVNQGLVAICKYLMAMTQFSGNSSSKEMKEATAEMTQFLATRIGGGLQ